MNDTIGVGPNAKSRQVGIPIYRDMGLFSVFSVHLDEVKDTLSLQDSSDQFPQEIPLLIIDNSAALFQPVGVFRLIAENI